MLAWMRTRAYLILAQGKTQQSSIRYAYYLRHTPLIHSRSVHGSVESSYDHDLEKMAAQQVIDTKILGKGVKTFGGDLNAQPWRSFSSSCG